MAQNYQPPKLMVFLLNMIISVGHRYHNFEPNPIFITGETPTSHSSEAAAIAVLQLHRGSPLEERLDHLDVAFLRRSHQGRPAYGNAKVPRPTGGGVERLHAKHGGFMGLE